MRFGWLWLIFDVTAGCFAAANSIPTLQEAPTPGPAASRADQPYRLRLTALVNPPSGVIGLILKAKLNGGPSLRLILDSGAEHLVIDSGAARKSGLSSGTELDLVGAGSPARAAQLTAAGVVEIGEMTLRDCPVIVVEGRLLDGVDGVIPLSLFSAFLVRLDVPGRVLELNPFPGGRQADDSDFVPAKAQRQLLFLETRLAGAHPGFFLLDTGSSYNVISNAAAAALRQARALAQPVPMVAGPGVADGRRLPCRVSFRLGDRALTFDSVVAVDLEEMSRRHGIDISGVIGYPALAGSVVTVNYREALVRIQPKK